MDKLSKPVFNDEEYESFLRLMKYVNDLNNNVIGFNEPYLKDLEIINRFITAHGQYSEYANAPSYEDLELLEKCYDKCNTLNDYVLKKDLQKVIKSLHHKYMDNEMNTNT